MPPPHDDVPPPGDLDLPAALAAEAHYRGAIAGGTPEAAAWSAAVELFRMHHPAWPLPLAEREAARIVGALIAKRGCAATPRSGANRRTPPLHLLRALSRPEVAQSPWASPQAPSACAAEPAARPALASRRSPA
jgi:hypothetical protein